MRPNKDFSASLRRQRVQARGQQPVDVGPVASTPSMTVPGLGGVSRPPGRATGAEGERGTRSAAEHADAMSRFGGGPTA